MKQKLLLLFCCILSMLQIKAQAPTYSVSADAKNWDCGYDPEKMAALAIDTGFIGAMNRYNNAINGGGNQIQSGGPFIVPVVFHVISTSNATSVLSYSQILWQMARLNAAFKNQMNIFNGQALGSRAVNTQIEFRLACVAQNCGAGFTNVNEPGVMRYATNDPNVLTQGVAPSSVTTIPMLAITHPTSCPTTFPFSNYLNIWCVPSLPSSPTGTVNAYGTFPWMSAGIDGIVTRIDIVGNNSYPTNFLMSNYADKGAILAHEVGHYLGLYHTFETAPTFVPTLGCYGTAVSTSTTQGDYILDTPPTFIGQDLGSVNSVNSCHENNFPYGGSLAADQNDQLENYMSYSDDDKLNTFTQGQANRMVSTFTLPTSPRYNLNTVGNLGATGTGVYPVNSCANNTGLLTALFNYSIAANSNCSTVYIKFTSPTSTGFTATSWNWSFGSTVASPTQSFATTGGALWTVVTCTASDGVNTAVSSQTVIANFNASIIGQSGQNMTVCKGSEQTIYISFGSNTPEVTLTDGTNQFSVQNYMLDYPYITKTVPYTFVANSSASYSLIPATCGTVNLGTATFSVVDCCNTSITNGDFNNAAPSSGYYTDLFSGAAPTNTAGALQFYGTYTVTTPGTPPWLNWIGQTTQNVTGNAMVIDGFQGNNGIVNIAGPTYSTNYVPFPPVTSCTTSAQTPILWRQTLTGLKPSTPYYYSFKLLENYSGIDPLASCLTLNYATSITYSTGLTALPIQTLSPVSHIGGTQYNYVVYTYSFMTSPSITTGTTFTVQINQINNFGGAYFDTFLDNILLQAMTPGIQALGTNTICPGQTTALTTTVNCGQLLSNYNVSWTPNIGLSCNTCTNPIANPSVTTTYTLVATPTSTVGGNPPITSYVTITVKPTFTITPPSQIIYSGSSATLTAGGSTGTYSWMPGSLTGSIVVVTPTATTIYTVTNAATGTCTPNNTATVTVSNACSAPKNGSIGTTTTSTTNFPASTTAYTVTGFIYDMQGTITFTGNTTFTGYTFRMAKGTKLKVNPNVTLTFNNCKLYGCTELWYGIELSTGDAINANINVQSGTTIEDMYYGIYREVPYVVGGNSAQGYINITNSKLNKNYFGVQLINVKAPLPAGSTYSLTVKASTLTTASSTTSPGNNLKPSTIPTYTYAYTQIIGGGGFSTPSYTNFPRSYTAINLVSLSPASNVLIGDTALVANTFNTFSNLDFGITASNAQLRVHNNYFLNLKGSNKYNQPPYTPNGPSDIGVAIVASHTVANTYSLQVGTKNNASPTSTLAYNGKANAFKTVGKGVMATNCSVLIAKGNYFEGDTTDIPSLVVNPNTYYYLKSQQAIWCSGLSTRANISFNWIKNYANGIFSSHTMSVSLGSSILMSSNTIQVPSTMGYCKQAIQIQQVGGANIAANLLEVRNNNITKVYNGIQVSSVLAGLYLHDNNSMQIEGVKTLGYTNATFQRRGIYITGCSNGIVDKNLSVYSSATITASNYQYFTGFYVNASQTNTVTCNSTNLMGRGFVYQGICTSNNGWLGNAISNSYQGLTMFINARLGTQGSAGGTLAANTWSNVIEETFVQSSPNVNSLSNMFVAPNSGSNKTAPTLNFATLPSQTYSVAFGQGIDIQASGTPFSCGGGGCGGCFVGESSSLSSSSSSTNPNDATYSDLATSTNTAYAIYPDEFVYQGQQLVYRLQKQGVVTKNASNTTLQSFYNTNTSSNIGKFTDVQDAVATNQKALAQTKNNSITPINSAQQKTKRTNELMLKLNSNPNYNFNNTELQDLVAMANECEVKGWYVTQSRNIINVVSKQIISYENVCEETEVSSRMANTEENTVLISEQKNEFLLFPNPNNGQMNLIYTIYNKQAAELIITDVTGRLISNYELPENSSNLHISELELKSGVYFYSIKQNNAILKQAKFVIMK